MQIRTDLAMESRETVRGLAGVAAHSLRRGHVEEIHVRIETEEAARALADLHESVIPYVVLSLGAEGALLACDAGVFHGKPPEITPRNTVGCGDSMTAGFAVGMARSLPAEDTFRMALAVSAASALSLFTGDFDPAEYERLLPEISIRRIL